MYSDIFYCIPLEYQKEYIRICLKDRFYSGLGIFMPATLVAIGM